MINEIELENYEILAKIGEGAYGTVFKIRDKVTGEHFAVKKIKLSNLQQGVPSTTICEIAILKELDHRNIIKLHHIIHKNQRINLVLDLCEMDLKHICNAFYD